MNELAGVDQWLYERFTGDVTLAGLVGTRVYADLAPQGAAFPLILYTFNAGSDLQRVGWDQGETGRSFARPRYAVKAVAEGQSYATAHAIANRIDALLQGQGANITQGSDLIRIRTCVREQPLRYVETLQGRTYRHLGGLYRFWVDVVPAP